MKEETSKQECKSWTQHVQDLLDMLEAKHRKDKEDEKGRYIYFN